MTTLKPIRTEDEYDRALARIEALWDAAPGTQEGDEMEALAIFVEAYEKEAHPIPPPHPIEALRFAMDQRGMRAKDLTLILGSSGRASEILQLKRSLTLPMIRRLTNTLGLDADVLIREYELCVARRSAGGKKSVVVRKPSRKKNLARRPRPASGRSRER